MRVVVIHGPNLNATGHRDPHIYGSTTLAEIDQALRAFGGDNGADVRCEQYSGEGEIIDALYRARDDADAVVLNPGAYAHYAYAIRDAVSAIGIPVIEVHLSNIYAREAFRQHSVIAPVCRGSITGFGARSYLLALRAALEQNRKIEGRRP